MSARWPQVDVDEIDREDYRDTIFGWTMAGIVVLVFLWVLGQVFAGETELRDESPSPAAYEHPEVGR